MTPNDQKFADHLYQDWKTELELQKEFERKASQARKAMQCAEPEDEPHSTSAQLYYTIVGISVCVIGFGLYLIVRYAN